MKKKGQNRGFIQQLLLVVILIFLFIWLVKTPLAQFFWKSFTSNMQKIQAGQMTDIQLAAPQAIFK